MLKELFVSVVKGSEFEAKKRAAGFDDSSFYKPQAEGALRVRIIVSISPGSRLSVCLGHR